MTTEPGNKSGRHGQRAAVPTLAPQVKGDNILPEDERVGVDR